MEPWNSESRNSFSPAIIEQLQKGNTIEAIKILREETGMNLLEAKEAIEKGAGANPDRNSPFVHQQKTISGEVLHQLSLGKKIDAIKVLRGETKMGLKDAKDAVEQALLDHPEIKHQYDESNKPGIITFFRTALIFAVAAYLLYIYFAGK
jgi:ribosomal protein L7/L12